MSSLRVGERAPGFTTLTSDKVEVHLSGFVGRNVVLLFFPFAFTGTCTKELCDMRDGLQQYEKLDAQILGISVDSPYVLKKYKEELNLNFPLLTDFNKQISKAYDCMYEEFYNGLRGVSKRAAFVIDKQGYIRYAEILENANNLPNFEAIIKVLQNLN